MSTSHMIMWGELIGRPDLYELWNELCITIVLKFSTLKSPLVCKTVSEWNLGQVDNVFLWSYPIYFLYAVVELFNRSVTSSVSLPSFFFLPFNFPLETHLSFHWNPGLYEVWAFSVISALWLNRGLQLCNFVCWIGNNRATTLTNIAHIICAPHRSKIYTRTIVWET